MMRSMVMEFTKDRNCAYLDKQYMLGDSLLVAPIFNDESKAIYYLPEGTWTHYLTGEVKEGGKWYEEPCGYLSIPVFAKENSLIAVGQEKMKPDYNYAENVEIRAYSLTDGGKASTYVCGMDRQVETTVTAARTGEKVEITVKAKKPCSILLVNETAKEVQGAPYQIEDKDTVISCIGNAQITVTL